MYLIPSENSRIFVKDSNGKLDQWLWKQSFLKAITLEKGINLKTKVLPESFELCRKPEEEYKSNFENLFVKYQGGFAIPGGELRTGIYSSKA